MLKIPKIIILVLSLSCIGLFIPNYGGQLYAQNAALTVGSATGTAGSAINLSVSFSPGPVGVSAFNFDLTLPASLSYASITAGSAATSASKSVSGNAIGGVCHVLIAGLNQNAIGSGVVATVRLNIANGTAAGNIVVGITGIVAADAGGNAVAATGTAGNVTVTVPVDSTAPSVPIGLTATAASSSQINLNWNPSTDNVGVTGYRIYRGGTQIATSATTSYSNTGLTASTAYSYTVAAYDAAGNVSAQSTAANATTQASTDTQAPSVPAGLTATAASASQINLNWNASTDNVGVTGYRIYRGGTQIATSAAATYQDSGLTASTSYSYRVAAYDAAGNVSAQSTAASATTSASSNCQASSSTFQNNQITSQTGIITVEFDATPNIAVMDGVVVVSSGAVADWSGLAAGIRFNTSGLIDAINGGTSTYSAATTVSYSAGISYHFRLIISLNSHTYSVYVKQAGGSEVNLGTDYLFRSSQNSISNINNWAQISEIGSMTVCGFTVPATTCDVNGDGVVNILDLQILSNALAIGTSTYNCDINKDGSTNILDYQLLGNIIAGTAVCPN